MGLRTCDGCYKSCTNGTWFSTLPHDRAYCSLACREAAEKAGPNVDDPHDDDINPRELLESSRVEWARDWDVLLLGFVLGVLTTLAVQGVW